MRARRRTTYTPFQGRIFPCCRPAWICPLSVNPPRGMQRRRWSMPLCPRTCRPLCFPPPCPCRPVPHRRVVCATLCPCRNLSCTARISRCLLSRSIPSSTNGLLRTYLLPLPGVYCRAWMFPPCRLTMPVVTITRCSHNCQCLLQRALRE